MCLSRRYIKTLKSKDRHLKFSPLGLLVQETEQILQIPSLNQKKINKEEKVEQKSLQSFHETNIANNQQDATYQRSRKKTMFKNLLMKKYKIQN